MSSEAYMHFLWNTFLYNISTTVLHILYHSMITHPHLDVVGPVQAQEVSAFKWPSFNLIEGPHEGSFPPHFLDLDSTQYVIVVKNPPRNLPANNGG